MSTTLTLTLTLTLTPTLTPTLTLTSTLTLTLTLTRSEHKLAPKGLPPPTRVPRVRSDGLTILNPFVSVGLAPSGEPEPDSRSPKQS
jgi:hypothetical protein